MTTPLLSPHFTAIDWNQAPVWAKWAAQDASGQWFFYEDEPIAEDGYFTVAGPESGTPPGRLDVFAHPIHPIHWRSSLTRRPEASTATIIAFPTGTYSRWRASYAVLPA